MTSYPTSPVVTGQSPDTAQPQADPPEESVTIRVADDGRSFELTVAEGTGTIGINGTSYAFDTAEIIGKAPVILAPPTTAAALPEDLAELTSVDYVTGPYLYDPAGGEPVVILRTIRGDEMLDLGPDYAPTPFDRIAGFSVRQEVVNGWGEGTATSEVVAPVAHAPAVLTFTRTSALRKADGIQAGGADSVLIVANTVLERRGGTLFRDPTGGKLRAYFSSGMGRLYASNLNGNKLLNFDGWFNTAIEIAEGDNVCLMLNLRSSGYAQVQSYRNGQVVASTSRTIASAAGKIDTSVMLTIGYTDFGSSKDYSIEGGYQDFRIWTDLAEEIDISTSSFAYAFMDETGAARNPALANDLFGTPRIWLPTDPAQANALVNLGTAGNFTAKSEEFA
ncbi:hypothetical protein [Paenirhodobacter populi]|uniref:Uncharacterized protein n=1 Tax=Paenirhodobacter populi TaxID=2306993 RepID=A0A443JC30_9RHOB|nr:hypothetical protein [Sinirhodobacter populi]RWR18034.1 hypothetical protein D2T30_17485 [Sinirhodobacter populi]